MEWEACDTGDAEVLLRDDSVLGRPFMALPNVAGRLWLDRLGVCGVSSSSSITSRASSPGSIRQILTV